MEKNSKKLKSDGVLYWTCPACGNRYRWKRGRRKHPRVKEIDNWIEKARCPNCGQLIKLYLKK